VALVHKAVRRVLAKEKKREIEIDIEFVEEEKSTRHVNY
jgi:hypothetical protein